MGSVAAAGLVLAALLVYLRAGEAREATSRDGSLLLPSQKNARELDHRLLAMLRYATASGAAETSSHLPDGWAMPAAHQSSAAAATGGAAAALQANAAEAVRSSKLSAGPPAAPTPWPPQFHAVLLQNRTGRLAMTDLWYDWRGGRNLNIIRSQLGRTLFDVEWNNRTSFYFDLEAKTCRRVEFEVGILPPSWLSGATYLGREEAVDGQFACNVWSKADFIQYYEHAETGVPVKWIFLGSGAVFHVMSFHPDEAMSEEEERRTWQAPAFCFLVQASTTQKVAM